MLHLSICSFHVICHSGLREWILLATYFCLPWPYISHSFSVSHILLFFHWPDMPAHTDLLCCIAHSYPLSWGNTVPSHTSNRCFPCSRPADTPGQFIIRYLWNVKSWCIAEVDINIHVTQKLIRHHYTTTLLWHYDIRIWTHSCHKIV